MKKKSQLFAGTDDYHNVKFEFKNEMPQQQQQQQQQRHHASTLFQANPIDYSNSTFEHTTEQFIHSVDFDLSVVIESYTKSIRKFHHTKMHTSAIYISNAICFVSYCVQSCCSRRTKKSWRCRQCTSWATFTT